MANDKSTNRNTTLRRRRSPLSDVTLDVTITKSSRRRSDERRADSVVRDEPEAGPVVVESSWPT